MLRYDAKSQAAIPYPDQELDPSLGMPHLFYQMQDGAAGLALIAPAPYNVDRFTLPPWFR